MDVVIIGTGMYSTGRGTSGYGTILPALLEFQRKNMKLEKIIFIGTNSKNSQESYKKYLELSNSSGILIDCKFYPNDNNINPDTYKSIIRGLKKPTCAIVAVPDNLHFPVAKECLTNGMHTLVVKPLTPKVEESKKLISLANQKKLYGAVEFHKRWDKQNLMLKDKINNNEIGEPLYTWSEYSQRKSIPSGVFKSWVEQSNIIQYLGVHYIDIIRFATKAKPIRVMAIGQKKWLKDHNINVHDSIQCIIEWQNTNNILFTQTLLLNWVDPETSSSMSDQKLQFVGTKGRFVSDQKRRGVTIISDNNNLEEPNPDFCYSYMNENNQSEYKGYGIKSITTFINDSFNLYNEQEQLNELKKIRPTFEESLISTSVIESASESLNSNGHWIKININ